MNRSALIRDGFVATLPYQIPITLFGLVSGAVMADAGLSLLEAVAMTVIVMAGAAQIAAMQMLIENTSVFVILASCICINLRFGMYSAALAPYFTGMSARNRGAVAYVVHDQSFAVSLARFQSRDEHWHDRMWFFLSAGGITALVWQSTTALGHIVGAKAPEDWPIDFAMPLIFIAMTIPFLRGSPRWLAAFVAGGSALVLREVPLDLGLLIATALGMAAGYAAETWTAKA